MAQIDNKETSHSLGNQGKVGRPKSEEKRENILIAASELFLANGFSSTSMDQVAKQAEVSKQTVYSHFSNKEALFSAVIKHKCLQYRLGREHVGEPDQDPFESLVTFGNQIVNLLLDEQSIAMHRVVIAESNANPRVAELFFEAGPLNGFQILGEYLQHNVHLKLDPSRAEYWSYTFFNMLKGDYHLRSLLGLQYCDSEEARTALVTQVTKQVLHLIMQEKQAD